jgi:hypothetical protein
MKKNLPHCDTERDYSAENPRVSFADGGRFFRLSFSRSPAMEWNQENFVNLNRDNARGVCKGFSFGSRRRMLDRLNQLSVAAEHPDFVTLTLPDDVFEDDVGSFAKTAKLHLDVLVKRLRRVCPSACGFWRIEWKARLSGLHVGRLFPHFHLLVWGLPLRPVTLENDGAERLESFIPVPDLQEKFGSLLRNVTGAGHVFKSEQSASSFSSRCTRPLSRPLIYGTSDVRHFVTFSDWVSLAWYDVVGSHNIEHFNAGCRVERIRSWGGVLTYCAKYMSKADSENFLADVAFGRSWGVFNRSLLPWAKMIEFPLADDVGVRVRRIARHYLEHRLGRRVQRHFGITVYCDTSFFKRLCESPPDEPF